MPDIARTDTAYLDRLCERTEELRREEVQAKAAVVVAQPIPAEQYWQQVAQQTPEGDAQAEQAEAQRAEQRQARTRQPGMGM